MVTDKRLLRFPGLNFRGITSQTCCSRGLQPCWVCIDGERTHVRALSLRWTAANGITAWMNHFQTQWCQLCQVHMEPTAQTRRAPFPPEGNPAHLYFSSIRTQRRRRGFWFQIPPWTQTETICSSCCGCSSQLTDLNSLLDFKDGPILGIVSFWGYRGGHWEVIYQHVRKCNTYTFPGLHCCLSKIWGKRIKQHVFLLPFNSVSSHVKVRHTETVMWYPEDESDSPRLCVWKDFPAFQKAKPRTGRSYEALIWGLSDCRLSAGPLNGTHSHTHFFFF